MRHDLDGDGVPTAAGASTYRAAFADAFPETDSQLRCVLRCRGYELMENLDFDTNGSGGSDAGDTYWNAGAGWNPIGNSATGFRATFDGNGRTVRNLFINRPSTTQVGLFGYAGLGSAIRGVGVTQVDVVGVSRVGSLVGRQRGTITASYATGRVAGAFWVGGLVGQQLGATISDSYATIRVSARQTAGGLVGNSLSSTVEETYASGRVSQLAEVGGLVGSANPETAISASYATARVTGTSRVGGLVGYIDPSRISYSYWDTMTSGQATGSNGQGQTTTQLQTPTGSTGIYVDWDDDQWDFGEADEYPALVVDFDGDGDATWEEFGYQLREGPTLTATAGGGQVVLEWNAVDATHWTPAPSVTYTLTRDDGATLETLGESLSGLTFTDTEVTAGTTYTYQVAAVVQGGEATRSAVASATAIPNMWLDPTESDPTASVRSQAIYSVTFQGSWTTTVTSGGLPSGAHFTTLIGGVHNAGVTFLREGGMASAGVESMAELGGTSTLAAEVRAAEPDALAVVQGSGGNIGPTGSSTINPVTLTTDHPRVTLLTMVAPSPDWFVGISGLSLLDAQGNWMSSQTVNLYPWDAGTEEGTEFSLTNSATSPQETITSLRGIGKFSNEPIATLTFTRQSVNTAPSFTSDTSFELDENRTVATTVVAADPDSGDEVAYAITGGADSLKFDIGETTGELTFKVPPNYESPADVTSTDPLNDVGNNEYVVTVTATGGTGGRALTAEQTITVTVRNLEEAGAVSFSQVGSAIRAKLSDPDGGVSGASWQWARSSERSMGWTNIGSATSASYTPSSDDQEKYLRATVSYDDEQGSGKQAQGISTYEIAPPDLLVSTLVSGLTIPWDLAFTPDGTMLFTERSGVLSSRLTNGTVRTVTAELGDVFSSGENGLMGIVVDPDFASNRRFYTCQAHTGPEIQVIAWTINAAYTTATRVADPLVGGMPAAGFRHGGCRLRFGPQGYLWIATGDAATGTVPQDLSSLGGKVLRVDASTGAGAPANPFASSPRIYTYGHRNVQGLALRPGTSQMWSVEHGPSVDDEINLLVAGRNYGWDPVPGYNEAVAMTELVKFPDALEAKWSSGSPTLATSGGIFLVGEQWSVWEGRMAVATLRDSKLRLFEFTPDGAFVSQVVVPDLDGNYGRLRTPMLGPDGALYVTTSNGGGVDRILRIVKDEAVPVTLKLTPEAIGENGGVSTVTARLSLASGQTTTVTVSAAAVSPAVPGDFTLSTNKTLTITAGQTSSTGTVTITANNNNVDTPNKMVRVSGTATNTDGVTGPSDVTLNIIDDDDPPKVTLELMSTSIGEGGGSTNVTARLDRTSSKTTTVTVSAMAVSPAVTRDFTLSSNKTLTIDAGQTTSSGTVTISANNNDVDTPDKTVRVSGTADNSHGVTDPDDVELTITDDDAAPTVMLRLSRTSIGEDGGSTTVTARLDRTSSETTTVTVSATAVSPAAARDFTLSSNKTLTIDAGQTTSSGTVTISANNNDVDTPDKTVQVSGTARNSHAVTNPDVVDLTITDDDDPPTVTLRLSRDSIGEDGGSTTVTARLDRASSETTTVTVSATAVSPAVEGDFSLSANKTLTIEAGRTSSTGTVTISANNNDVDTPDKTVQVSGSASNDHAVTDPDDVELTITDDDAAPTVMLRLSRTSIVENGGSATVTARLDRASSETTTVTVSATAESPAVEGDFTLSQNKTLTILLGDKDSTGTVRITANNNSVDTPNKTLKVSGTASNSQGVTDPAEVTLTITDDDASPALTLEVSSTVIAESAGNSTVTVRITNGVTFAEDQQIRLSFAGTAEKDTDYTVGSESLSLMAGDSSVTTTITAVDDQVVDVGETILVTATHDRNAVGSQQTITITDDDAAPVVTTASPILVAENETDVATLAATDLDDGVGDLEWEITGGADRSKFMLVSGGDLTFRAAKDYENPDDANRDRDYEITVRVSDGANPVQAGFIVRLQDVDDTAPLFSSAVVNGATLTLAYNEALDESSTPPNAAFTVTGGTQTRTVTGVGVRGSAVELTLNPAVDHGETGIRVSYAVPTGMGQNPVQDTAGNDAVALSNRGVANSTGDTTAPTVSAVAITSNAGADRAYGVEDAIEATVTFNEAVVVTGSPRLTLNVGGRNRPAEYRSVTGMAVRFEYEVASGDIDTDGVSIEANQLTQGGGTIRDGADNDAVLDHDAVADDMRHQVDGVAPTLAASDPAVVNEATLTLSYDEALDSSSLPQPSAFTLAGGDATRNVTRVRVSGSEVLLTLSPPAEHAETGITLSYRPGANPIQDRAGNDATGFTNRSVENTTQDTTAPEVSGIDLVSDPGIDETYAAGEVIEVSVRFSEPVAVAATNGAPTLALRVGNRSKPASYDTVSNEVTVMFVYTVADDDIDSDGVSIPAGRISLNGGTIEDLADNPAVLRYEALAVQSGHKVDGVRPRLRLAVAGNDELVLSYDEVLDEDSTPAAGDFTVTVEGNERTLTRVSVVGSALTLTLEAEVTSGDTVTVSYRPGTNPIQDAAGNDAEELTDHAVATPGPGIPPPPPGGGGGGGGGFGFGGGGGGPSSPGAPENLTAVGGDGEVVLTWEVPARDGGAEITDYEYRIDLSPPWISTGSSDTTHIVTGLVNGTTYVFEVRAVNRIGKSFASNQAEATPMIVPRVSELSARPGRLSYSFVQPSDAAIQRLLVIHEGEGSVSFQVDASKLAASPWLSVAPLEGEVSAAAPVTLRVEADPALLAADTYFGQILIVSAPNDETGGGSSLSSDPAVCSTCRQVRVEVVMAISSRSQMLRLSQRGLTFTAVAGGGVLPVQQLQVLNEGMGVMAWDIGTQTISGGDWLSVTPLTGVGEPSLPAAVDVAVRTEGLSPGAYYGLVEVAAPEAANSPQLSTVVLNLLAGNRDPGPVVAPAGLLFSSLPTDTAPSPQSLRITNLVSRSIPFTAQGMTLTGDGWLSPATTEGMVHPGETADIAVEVLPDGLAAGIYRGLLRLRFLGGSTVINGTPTRDVDVVLVVAPEGVCSPTELAAVFKIVGGTSPIPAGWPAGIEVEVVDDCGARMNSGYVAADFAAIASPGLSLEHAGEGLWSATWNVPAMEVDSMAEITVTATDLAGITGTLAKTLELGANSPSVPRVAPQGVVHSASLAGDPLAPGTIISIFGSNLSESPVNGGGRVAVSVPLRSEPPPGTIAEAFDGNPPDEPVGDEGSGVVSVPLPVATAPGTLALLFGGNLSGVPVRGGGLAAIAVPLPAELAATQVTLGGLPLPLLFSREDQVNAVVPFELADRLNEKLPLLVRRTDTASVGVPESVLVIAARPGVFTQDASGSGPGMIQNVQFQVVSPDNPVRAGDTVIIYGTGWGAVSPAVASGGPAPFSPMAQLAEDLTVTIGGRPAEVVFAGLVPRFTSLYQVNAVVPSALPDGEAEVVLSIAGQVSPAVTLAVE